MCDVMETLQCGSVTLDQNTIPQLLTLRDKNTDLKEIFALTAVSQDLLIVKYSSHTSDVQCLLCWCNPLKLSGRTVASLATCLSKPSQGNSYVHVSETLANGCKDKPGSFLLYSFTALQLC